MSRPRIRCPVLTVAGSDGGGGAGLQRDLALFRELDAHGISVITAVTCQSPAGIDKIKILSPHLVEEQFLTLCREFQPRVMKTGMLGNSAIVSLLARILPGSPIRQFVLDPVLVSSSGSVLLNNRGFKLLLDSLFPLATIVTPNIPETGEILGMVPQTPSDMRDAARDFFARFKVPVLIKGGHLRNRGPITDIFYNGRKELILEGKRSGNNGLPGTGCALSAGIAATLAKGSPLPLAVKTAHDVLQRKLRLPVRVRKFKFMY